MPCPLCRDRSAKTALAGNDARNYRLCGNCALIYVHPDDYLSREQERAYYGTHDNSIDNRGYVAFLNRLADPMLDYLEEGMRGLDYGCGPGPTLSRMLERRGMECEDYDPLFLERDLRPPYDFITATECLEHFHRPAEELERIARLLRPGGLLGIMTERWTTPEAFAGWYYTRDPTHVCFYHADTLDYICRQFGFAMLWRDGKQAAILRRERL